MALMPLSLPAGVVKPGSVYDAKGRWHVADFIRWHNGVMQPMGGWAVLSGATGTAVGGPVRGLIAWRRNNGDAKLWIGTPTKAYSYADGTLTAITPVGFTTGASDASGDYWARVEANTWQVDTYGEDIMAVAKSDGKLYQWDSSAGGAMAAVTNAPTGNLGVVVTPERFLFALGASSDARNIAWPDQDDITDWTATVTNQAGSHILTGSGQILSGRRSRNETLIWTDVDLFSARYIGGDLIYSFKEVGSRCGAISRNAMTVVDGWAMWMGQDNFYLYDGAVRALPSDVSDFVFGDINRVQASKIACMPLTDFNEVWWFYPSSSATENDRMVGVNYREGHWMVVDSFERTAGVDRGFLEFPIMADAAGAVYFHENGTAMVDEGGTPTYTPNAESGPVELGNGDRTMHIRSIVPSEKTLGDLDFHLLTSLYPMGDEQDHGPFPATEITDARASGRQVRLKFVQDQTDWRFGTPRLDVVPGGKR